MKCPHCNTGIRERSVLSPVVTEPPVRDFSDQPIAPPITWNLYHQRCPECHRSIIRLELQTNPGWPRWDNLNFMAYPRSYTRPVTPEVPNPYRQDFTESYKVLADSPKASAALSRRCLQMIIADKLGTTKRDLYYQIEEVIASGNLPSYIVDGLHAVRNIGNFAAHPSKSTSTGTIVDVEPGEAEWNLEVVEMLFDFCFVQPAIAAKRKAQGHEQATDSLTTFGL
jgi:hypothetical protein